MNKQNWNTIYEEQGEIQSDVLPTVANALKILKAINCKKILDLGCGTGRHSIYLAKEGFEVHACDLSAKAIEITSQKAKSQNLSNIIVRQCDMLDTPYDDNFFDAVLCVWTTGHGLKKDIKKSVKEMHRVLKNGGLLITDFISTDDDHYGVGEEIEPDTFLGNMPGEEDIPHHYSTKEELGKFFAIFSSHTIKPIIYRYGKNNENMIKAFYIEAIK